MNKTILALLSFVALSAAAQTFSASTETSAPSCGREAGSLPNLKFVAGTPNAQMPINHIVVIMQENHSFDNYMGMLNSPEYYGNQVDGVSTGFWNPDSTGKPIYSYHEKSLCSPDPQHGWDAMHSDWNGGKNDQFVRQNKSSTVMGFYDHTDLPFYYSLANEFSIGDRYFCSVLSQTFPNRYFLLAGTAFGHIKNDEPKSNDQWNQKTIFDVLNQYHVSWKYYTDDQGYLKLFHPMWERNQDKMAKIEQWSSDVKNGALPSVSFIDSSFDGSDEHPDADVQKGQAWVAARTGELLGSKSWQDSVLFLTYDENGGFFDHVAPPEACIPDGIEPMLEPTSYKARYDRYGMRVPFFAVSPWVKRHFVSHRTYDHTSVLKFIETKFNLPALTRRDANADGLLDLFDFQHPRFDVPVLANGAADPSRECQPPSTRAADLF